MANQSLLDREQRGVVNLEVCTKQITPFVGFSLNKTVEVNTTTPFSTSKLTTLNALSNTTLMRRIIKHEGLSRTDLSTEKTKRKPIPRRFTPVGTVPLLRTVPASFEVSPFDPNHQKTSTVVTEPLPFGARTTPRDFETEKIQEFIRETAFKRQIIPHRQLNTTDVSFHHQQFRFKRSKGKILRRNRQFTSTSRPRTRKLVRIKPLGRVTTATNSNIIPLDKSCATVKLTLLDANDNNPRFIPSNQYEFSITEDTLPGTIIGTVSLL